MEWVKKYWQLKEQNKSQPYEPDWRSEQEICEWLGVSKTTLYRWRQQFGLAFTNVNGKTLMYDKKQITGLLNKNSTYAMQGMKLAP